MYPRCSREEWYFPSVYWYRNGGHWRYYRYSIRDWSDFDRHSVDRYASYGAW